MRFGYILCRLVGILIVFMQSPCAATPTPTPLLPDTLPTEFSLLPALALGVSCRNCKTELMCFL